MEMSERINRFLEDNEQLSQNTKSSYKRDLEQFADYLLNTNKKDFLNVTPGTIVSYMLKQRSLGKAASTICRSLATIRIFYCYLTENDVLEFNPTIGLDAPKSPKKEPQILSNDEARLLLQQPDTDDIKGIRDKAMLELLYATGIKVSELMGLNLTDYDKNNNVLKLSSGNRKREFNLESIKDYICNYIEISRPILMGGKNEEALFLNANGGRLTRQGFWKIVKNYKDYAKINKEITPITLRHSHYHIALMR